jgi:hypothetical protein
MAYNFLLVIKQAIITANSLDGAKLAAAIEQTKGLQLDIPGVQDSFSATDHTGWPDGALKECTLKQGPYDILYAAS